MYFNLFPNWLFINDNHRGSAHFILDSEEIIIQPQLDLPLLDYKELLVQTRSFASKMHYLSFFIAHKQAVCPYLLNKKPVCLIAVSLSYPRSQKHEDTYMLEANPSKLRPVGGDLLLCSYYGDVSIWRQLLLNNFKSSAGNNEGAKRWQKEAKVGGLLFKWLLKTVYNERLTLALMHSCPKAHKACSYMGDL